MNRLVVVLGTIHDLQNAEKTRAEWMIRDSKSFLMN